MGRKRKGNLEFRFYEVPQNEYALILIGEKWRQEYGKGIGTQHFHNLLEIGICHEGQGVLTLNGMDYPFQTGVITIIPQNYPHHTQSDDNTLSFWEYLFIKPEQIIELMYASRPAFKKQVLERINSNGRLLQSDENPVLRELILSALEISRQNGEFRKEKTKWLMCSLLLELCSMSPEGTNNANFKMEAGSGVQIENALKYIEGHYMHSIKIEELAETCNMSETHFRRIFLANINMKPLDYVNLVRIQHACRLLRNTNGSMEDIAVKVGFETISTFNRNFKKYLDASPYQWKRNPGNYESKLQEYNISALHGW